MDDNNRISTTCINREDDRYFFTFLSFCFGFDIRLLSSTTRKRQLRSDNSEATNWRRQLGSDNLEATTRKRQHRSDNLEATTQKRQHRSDNLEATTRKRQLRSDNLEATTWKRQLGSDNSEATTRKRQLRSDNSEATTWKRQLVTLIGFRTQIVNTNPYCSCVGSRLSAGVSKMVFSVLLSIYILFP